MSLKRLGITTRILILTTLSFLIVFAILYSYLFFSTRANTIETSVRFAKTIPLPATMIHDLSRIFRDNNTV